MSTVLEFFRSSPWMASLVTLWLLSPLLISSAFALRAKARGWGAKALFVGLCTLGSFLLFSLLGELLFLVITPELYLAIEAQFMTWRFDGYYDRYPPIYWLAIMYGWFVQWWWILIWMVYPITALFISYFLSKYWLQRAPDAR